MRQATSDRKRKAEQGGAPKHVAHESLRNRKAVATLLEAALGHLKNDGPVRGAREDALFKAMHACGFVLDPQNRRFKPAGYTLCQLRALHQRIADRLVNDNIGLVYGMYSRLEVDGDNGELVSAGFWTLFQALLSFDPWRGFRFSTYACHAILRSFHQVGRREARQREVLQEVHQATDVSDILEVGRAGATVLFEDRLRQVLAHNTADLTSSERFIIEQRFLRTDQPRGATLSAVGEMVQLSKERVRQIQQLALDKLRKALEQDPHLARSGVVPAGPSGA